MTAESLDDLVARRDEWSQAHVIAVQAREWLDRDGLIKRPRDQEKITAIIERAVTPAIKEALAEIVALRARAEKAERDRNQATEAVHALTAGKPLGEVAGLHTIQNLAAEVLALRTALRKHAIRPALSPGEQFTAGCRQCNADWPQYGGEVHAPGCLAEQIDKDKGG